MTLLKSKHPWRVIEGELIALKTHIKRKNLHIPHFLYYMNCHEEISRWEECLFLDVLELINQKKKVQIWITSQPLT